MSIAMLFSDGLLMRVRVLTLMGVHILSVHILLHEGYYTAYWR